MRVLPPPWNNAIALMHWPLNLDATPPLYFENLVQMQKIRSDPNSEDANEHCFWQDLPSTIDTLFPVRDVTDDSEQRHFGLISLALILLGHGYTDECHNLITPLSWPDDIHFAHGPSLYATASPDVRTYATYVHGLVHRKEAFHVGEFGMVGYQNANFWSNAFAQSSSAAAAAAAASVGQSSSPSSFPHTKLHGAIQQGVVLKNEKFTNHGQIQNWCQKHGFQTTIDYSVASHANDEETFFDPRAIHELCAVVLRQQQQQKGDPILQAFAEEVATTEVRVLLEHTIPKAGFEIIKIPQDDDNSSNNNNSMNRDHQTNLQGECNIVTFNDATRKLSIDPDVAMMACRRISSAHLDGFRSNGSIILRRMLVEDSSSSSSSNNNKENDTRRRIESVAAGVACRLLEAHACRRTITDGTENTVAVDVAVVTSEAADDSASTRGVSNMDLGDVLASHVSTRLVDEDDHSKCTGTQVFRFVATTASDTSAAWVDPFYDTRGETPTTVIQWSKGTTF